ncbi:MAG: hypothetical protein ABUL44_02700 [Flavobacterium sp.]
MKILLIIVVVLVATSCAKQRKISLIGFAYQGDKIILHAEQNKKINISVNEGCSKNSLCSFSREVKLNSEDNGIRVNIVIDSSNVKLLDTLVIIPKNYKEPFISFLHPTVETNYSRELFIADEDGFPKY